MDWETIADIGEILVERQCGDRSEVRVSIYKRRRLHFQITGRLQSVLNDLEPYRKCLRVLDLLERDLFRKGERDEKENR